MAKTKEKVLSRWEQMTIEQRKAAVAAGVNELRSASFIAKQLGTTRNAVLGLAHRRGVKMVPKEPAQPNADGKVRVRKPRPPRPPRERKPQPVAVKREAPAMVEDTAPVVNVAAWAVLPGSTPLMLHECTDKHCHWPVYGEGEPKLFCAEPVANTKRRYCAAHSARS